MIKQNGGVGNTEQKKESYKRKRKREKEKGKKNKNKKKDCTKPFIFICKYMPLTIEILGILIINYKALLFKLTDHTRDMYTRLKKKKKIYSLLAVR